MVTFLQKERIKPAALPRCLLSEFVRVPLYAAASQLGCLGNQFAVMTTIAKKLIGMGFLEVVAPDLLARNLRRDGQYRHTAAMAIIEPSSPVAPFPEFNTFPLYR
jgi:hypothetical protein